MKHPVYSHGGYVHSLGNKKILPTYRFQDQGIMVADNSGLKFEGKQGQIIIPITAIIDISHVFDRPGDLAKLFFLIINPMMIASYIVYRESSFNLIWFAVALVSVNLILFWILYRSSWIKIKFQDLDSIETIYFSTVWNNGIFPRWRFFKDQSLLSYWDNRKIVEGLGAIIYK